MSEAHKVVWFAPDRPTGGTVYIRPEPDDDDPHGGMTCAEVEEWADDMCGEINAVSHLLARRGYVRAKPDDDLFDDVFHALSIAALTGKSRPLSWPIPEEWFA